MTPTAEDLALDAGVFPLPRRLAGHRGWRTDDAEEFPLYPTPFAALAAAGRALGLKPKWVVVPVEVADEMAPNLRTLADWFGRCYTGLNTEDDVQRDLRALADALSSTPKDGDKP